MIWIFKHPDPNHLPDEDTELVSQSVELVGLVDAPAPHSQHVHVRLLPRQCVQIKNEVVSSFGIQRQIHIYLIQIQHADDNSNVKS